jgi:hypothetical protein
MWKPAEVAACRPGSSEIGATDSVLDLVALPEEQPGQSASGPRCPLCQVAVRLPQEGAIRRLLLRSMDWQRERYGTLVECRACQVWWVLPTSLPEAGVFPPVGSRSGVLESCPGSRP